MRRLFTVVFCVLGFLFIAAPTAVEYRPLIVNGQSWGNLTIIQGTYAFPLADFCRLGGGTLTLEDLGLTLTDTTLKISSQVYDAFHKHKDTTPANVKIADPAAVKIDASTYKPQAPYKESPVAVKIENIGRWKRQHDGVITTHAIRYGGGVYIPLSDLARAFGGTFTAPAAANPANAATGNNTTPGDAVRLNFTKTPNAILIGL
jgi:hypothetical protein